MKKTIIRIASYVWDIPIHKTSSQYNEYLEVVWSNGKKMLNTREANFSFGNGYAVFEQAIKQIEPTIQKTSSVLILGFGCGSILHILDKKYAFKGAIVGVEYDSKIIELYHTYFAYDYAITPKIHASDAFSYTKEQTEKHNIIFIDLFIELDNSPLIFNSEFLGNLKNILTHNGTLVFNTTKRTEKDKNQLSDLLITLSTLFKDVSTLSFQELNSIIIAK